jgi:hypothetical protein
MWWVWWVGVNVMSGGMERRKKESAANFHFDEGGMVPKTSPNRSKGCRALTENLDMGRTSMRERQTGMVETFLYAC